MKILKFGAMGLTRPCEHLKAALETMETPYEVEGIDIEVDKDKIGEYELALIPTLILVDDNGVEQKRFEGLGNFTHMKEWLDE